MQWPLLLPLLLPLLSVATTATLLLSNDGSGDFNCGSHYARQTSPATASHLLPNPPTKSSAASLENGRWWPLSSVWGGTHFCIGDGPRPRPRASTGCISPPTLWPAYQWEERRSDACANAHVLVTQLSALPTAGRTLTPHTAGKVKAGGDYREQCRPARGLPTGRGIYEFLYQILITWSVGFK